MFKSINSSALSILYSPTLTSIHNYWKNHSFAWWTSVGKEMSLLFSILSRLVIAFLPRSKCLLISWLQSPSEVILEPKEIKSLTFFIVSPSICHEVMGPEAMILVFWMLSFKPAFPLSSFTFIKGLFSSSSLSAIRVVLSAYLSLLIFLLAIESILMSIKVICGTRFLWSLGLNLVSNVGVRHPHLSTAACPLCALFPAESGLLSRTTQEGRCVWNWLLLGLYLPGLHAALARTMLIVFRNKGTDFSPV